jgi:hypothetical protein
MPESAMKWGKKRELKICNFYISGKVVLRKEKIIFAYLFRTL